MDYTVVGVGAIGGTVGARLVRDGHRVLFCDADAEHAEAISTSGLEIEGPVEELRVSARCVSPVELPDGLEAVLLAVKAHHTADAIAAVAPRLAPDGFVVSLQNGLNEATIAEAVGVEHVVGAFVNFGADVVAPGRILLGNRATFRIGELDGRASARVERLVADLEDAEATANVLGYLWAKLAYGAILFATAVSDLSIADALAEPRYRPAFVGIAREVIAAAPVPLEAFDGFDPAELEESIERLVRFNRGSAKTHSGIYRDLAVRHRKTEADAILGAVDGPLIRRTHELIRSIEEGRRRCQSANLDLLAAYERLERVGRPLNALIGTVGAPARAVDGPLLGVQVAVKDNMDLAGTVTTNASTVAVPPPASGDAEVVGRVRAAAGDVFCKTNLLEYAAGSVSSAFGMTRNPRDGSRTSGGSSSGSAALVAAGVCRQALGSDTGGSIRIPASYCGIVGLKPTFGAVPVEGVFPLSPSLDHVGTLTATCREAAQLYAVLAGRDCALDPAPSPRVGLLRQQLEDGDLRPDVRDRVASACDALASLGCEVVDIEIPSLDRAGDALDHIVLREAWLVHRSRFAREEEKYGPGTRSLLELGATIDDGTYEAALEDKRCVARDFERALEQVDVLAGPTVAYPAPAEDPPFGAPQGALEARFTGPYNLAGIPAVSVPCGVVEGKLPVGLQLAAGSDREAFLLSVAALFEEAGS